MPSPPPYDLITTIPAIAISQLSNQIDNITQALVSRALSCVQDVVKLPESVKCSNPNIDRIKNKLRFILNTINKILQTIPIIQTIASVLQTIGLIAAAALTFLIIVPLPTPPAAIPVIQAQSGLISNILSGISTLKIILNSIQSILQLVVSKLDIIFSFLISKCGAGSIQDLPDVDINVRVEQNSDTDSSLDSTANDFTALSCFLESIETKFSAQATTTINYNEIFSDNFYQIKSVPDSTLIDRNNNIQSLLDLQLNVLETLKQSPSKFLTGIGVPNASIGFFGDYYIDIQNNTIYGPKPSDAEWNNGIIIPS